MKYEISTDTGNGLRHRIVEFSELRKLILDGVRIYSLNPIEVKTYAKPGSNPCAEVVLPIMGNYAPGIFSVLGAEILKRHTRPDIE